MFERSAIDLSEPLVVAKLARVFDPLQTSHEGAPVSALSLRPRSRHIERIVVA